MERNPPPGLRVWPLEVHHAQQDYCSRCSVDAVGFDRCFFSVEFNRPINECKSQRERYATARQNGTCQYQVNWRRTCLQPARRNTAGHAGCSKRLRQNSAD